MGHIKEPEGVDLIIKSRPLTKEEEITISNYIRAYKIIHSPKKVQSKRTISSTRKKNADSLIKK
jgi:hypothetical protein